VPHAPTLRVGLFGPDVLFSVILNAVKDLRWTAVLCGALRLRIFIGFAFFFPSFLPLEIWFGLVCID